ncbi:MAG TPA: hypothetical protein DEO39_05285 [Clostridiales bacterium]|nr:hypothetical protein [Clostridiales bacterium]
MKLIFDENGNLIESIDDSEDIEEIIDIENDPYWKAPIPVEQRKHRKDKKRTSNKELTLKIALVAISVILLLVILYKIIIVFI